MSVFGIPRYAMLDVWMALGGSPRGFDEWMEDDPRRTDADSWAQLMAAVKNDLIGLLEDTNPPTGALLLLVEARLDQVPDV